MSGKQFATGVFEIVNCGTGKCRVNRAKCNDNLMTNTTFGPKRINEGLSIGGVVKNLGETVAVNVKSFHSGVSLLPDLSNVMPMRRFVNG